MIASPAKSSSGIPPLGNAESWQNLVPDAKHRWWTEAMTRLVNMSDDELSTCDIGEINLIVAFGLPGAGALDVGRYIARLDEWAGQVAKGTERNWKRFECNRAEFKNSPNFYRIVAMVTVLQRDLGVRYDPRSREAEYNASDAREWFLHGILDRAGGTCVSMPILYVAIGRRLGYPLRLVPTWNTCLFGGMTPTANASISKQPVWD